MNADNSVFFFYCLCVSQSLLSLRTVVRFAIFTANFTEHSFSCTFTSSSIVCLCHFTSFYLFSYCSFLCHPDLVRAHLIFHYDTSLFFSFFHPPLLFNIQAIQLELCLWVQIKKEKKRKNNVVKKQQQKQRLKKKYKLPNNGNDDVRPDGKRKVNDKTWIETEQNAIGQLHTVILYHNFALTFASNQKVTQKQIDTKLWLHFIYSCHSALHFIFFFLSPSKNSFH